MAATEAGGSEREKQGMLLPLSDVDGTAFGVVWGEDEGDRICGIDAFATPLARCVAEGVWGGGGGGIAPWSAMTLDIVVGTDSDSGIDVGSGSSSFSSLVLSPSPSTSWMALSSLSFVAGGGRRRVGGGC